jgi:3-mercaptopropionate dioxygenase
MTTITAHRTGLGELVAAIRAEVLRGRDWNATAAGVEAVLLENPPAASLLEEAELTGAPDRAAGHRLHVEDDGSFSVLAIVWREGQWTSIHDHVTWCVFAGVQGEVAEERYRLDGDGARLVPAGRQRHPVGSTACEIPPGDIHRLGNPHVETAITLHVYGTDVDRLGTSARRTYDLPVAG